MRKRETCFRQFSNRDFRKRYPRKDLFEILPLKSVMGMPFFPQALKRLGQSSVSARRRSLGWTRLIAILIVRGWSRGKKKTLLASGRDLLAVSLPVRVMVVKMIWQSGNSL
jgi:hypothetical protein